MGDRDSNYEEFDMGKTQNLKLNRSYDISALNNLNAGLKRPVIDTNGGVILDKILCHQAEQNLANSKPAEGPSIINKQANKSKINNILLDMVIPDQAENEHKFSQNLGEPIPE